MTRHEEIFTPVEPDAPIPKGIRGLLPWENDSFLRKFPGYEGAAPPGGGEAVGLSMDLRGGHVVYSLLIVLSLAVSAVVKLSRFFGRESFLWLNLAAAALVIVIAAYILINDVTVVFQSGTVFFRRRSGFGLSRRLLHTKDIQTLLRVELHSSDPDARHSVELSLANGEKLLLLDAGTDRGKANWLLTLIHRSLGLPVELLVVHGLGNEPADAKERAREPKEKQAAGVTDEEECSLRGGFAPDIAGKDFNEFSVLLPGMSAYDKFRKKMPSSSVHGAEQSGFVIREENLTAISYFSAAMLLLLATGMWIGKDSGLLSVTTVLLAILAAMLVGAFASLTTEKKHFFFASDMLLVCKRNGAVLYEIPRESIADIRTRRIVPGWLRGNQVEGWEISVDASGREIRLKTFRNTKDAKWLVETVRAWINRPLDTEVFVENGR